MSGARDGIAASIARRPRWLALAALIAGGTVGMLLRGMLPPFVIDDPFWREFLTGPPAAGLFALGGAFVAYWAASIAARVQRRAAEREEWWDRAEWALNLARSPKKFHRLIGLRALEALQDQATDTELQMIVAVTEAVTGDVSDVDAAADQADNGRRRRWFGWPRRSA